ncbi:TetR family transcriptional regulator [Rhodococcus sp. D2-41]|uniref:TetR family transcriptional regulator n=1 Tax=Speluncibacter jeojiensis TaxID=2710754 RepID=A0A9X4M8C1_9ACTN|nr:TetR family transcriptional regulator [Rhodococcus sp. D2-41]MDG3010331.1 TetR family transcriptional regulator [Rhodococcus sp. D2-41]MDG3017193.1 TetR family transcriptional regulator [Corynebacteriales bacterium D3-21]
MTSPDARERILLAGERLIAERGVEVPLREVAAAAGQRNNSAVHYHFGSRDGLIQAILDRRQTSLEARQLALLAEHEDSGGDDDPASLVEIMVRPMLEIPYADGSTHYARFLEQVRPHRVIVRAQLSVERWPAIRIVMTRLHRALAPMPDPLRRRRITAMATAMFALLADHERADAGEAAGADRSGADDLVAMLVGMLTAPSPATTGSDLPKH